MKTSKAYPANPRGLGTSAREIDTVVVGLSTVIHVLEPICSAIFACTLVHLLVLICLVSFPVATPEGQLPARTIPRRLVL